MTKVSIKVLATTVANAVTLLVRPSSARAQDASETVYEEKCAAGLGPDGRGSTIGDWKRGSAVMIPVLICDPGHNEQ
jgi:cytochrome c